LTDANLVGKITERKTDRSFCFEEVVMSNRFARVRKGRLLFAAGTAVVAGLAVASVEAPLAASAQSAAPDGAWADSSSWDGVIDRLRHAGYPTGRTQ
jgi:hypothetical protein